MKQWILLIAVLTLLVGCSSEKTSQHVLNVNATISTDAEKQQVLQAGKILEDVCPLLGVYSRDIASAEAKIKKPIPDYENLGWKNYVEVEVVVNNPVKVIPREYYAAGHHCYFDVGDKTVRVAKKPCAKICKGGNVTSGSDGTYWFSYQQ